MKRILLISLAAVLLLTAVIAGGLGYEAGRAEIADKGKIDDMGTSGSITDFPKDDGIAHDGDIVTLIKQQRKGDELVAHEGKMELYPLVGSAQYDGNNFDKFGMPTAKGYCDYIISAKNTTSDKKVYVRFWVAVPAALDNSSDAGKNALHFNLGNRFFADGSFLGNNRQNDKFGNYSIGWTPLEKTIYGIDYNIYAFTYKSPLSPGEVSPAPVVGFYLDKDAEIRKGEIYLDGKDTGFRYDNVSVYTYLEARTIEFGSVKNTVPEYFNDPEKKNN